jgi:hypothetical protein
VILVISHAADDHAVGVLAALHRGGHPAVLVDTARFPTEFSVAQHYENGGNSLALTVDGRTFELTECGAAWWRRPQPFVMHPGLDPKTVSFAYSECHEAIAGLWAALEARWVNPPDRDELAHHKPFQLAEAIKVDLRIPRTLITNDPSAARCFIDALGPDRTVYKTFLATEACWRETRVLRQEELVLLDHVRLAPVIFQEFVGGATNVRVTVVGEQVFATAIAAEPTGYGIDYRMDMDRARWEPTTLSDSTSAKLRALMQHLGLVYGAIDLLRTADGEDVFLEVNPAGEWRFVEERTGQPITAAVADLLAALDRR